jgi:hypothetical protein
MTAWVGDAAGLNIVADVTCDVATGAGRAAPAGVSVCLRVTPIGSAAAGSVGWHGETPVSDLDKFAASVPVDDERLLRGIARRGGDPERAVATIRRYRRARLRGSAPASLPATADAIGLLLADDAQPVIAARADAVANGLAATAAAARAHGALTVLAEVAPHPVEHDLLVAAVAAVVDALLVPVPSPLPQLLESAVAARRAGATGAVFDIPCDEVHTPEQLADVLDLLAGAGIERALLATNPGWLLTGPPTVARAAARLRGRPGPLDDERSRRTEMLDA